MSKSILQTEKECYLCRKFYDLRCQIGLELHHIFGGTANRKLSDKDGLVVYLCKRHHNTEPDGVHFNNKNMETLRKDGQLAWEKRYTGHYDFMKKYGKNYL